MFCKCLNLLKKLDYVRLPGRLGEERSDKVTGNNCRTRGGGGGWEREKFMNRRDPSPTPQQ